MQNFSEIEQAFLGCLLVKNELIDLVGAKVMPDDFASSVHGEIYQAVLDALANGDVADPVTLKAKFDGHEGLRGVNGSQYLVHLVKAGATIDQMPTYARQIAAAAKIRGLACLGNQIEKMANAAAPSDDVSVLVNRAANDIFTLASDVDGKKDVYTIADSLDLTLVDAEQAYKSDGRMIGISTGFVDLDRKTGGLTDQALYILAARPAMGKSALAVNIGENMARNGARVLIFSLEMSHSDISYRILSRNTRVSSFNIRGGAVNDRQMSDIINVSNDLRNYPMTICDKGGLSIDELGMTARRVARQSGVDVIIVDYLQLMRGRSNNGNRVQEITEITTSLKALAKDLNVPVLALSQLSRKVEEREDKRPMLSDLRESGSIEQDADQVWFIYRAEYYLQGREPDPSDKNHEKWAAAMEKNKGKAEVIIAKHRGGSVGTVDMAFNAELTEFNDMVSDNHYPDFQEWR